MPEGDTVYLAAQRLDRALSAQEISRSDFRVPKLATVDLSGRRVESVLSRGKHLLWRFSDGLTLHTHFRMDGQWHLYRPRERWRKPGFEARVVLHTSQWTAVGFRLPVVELLPTDEEERVVGHLGPDLLGADWDAQEAVRRLARDGERTISDALLDQRNLAGVGNVYRCEICFLRGLDPWRPVAGVEDLAAVVDLTKRLFEANRGRGGHVTTGNTRRGSRHWVYGRRGRPCLRCGTHIRYRSAPDGTTERVTYWCPHCQPAVAAESVS